MALLAAVAANPRWCVKQAGNGGNPFWGSGRGEAHRGWSSTVVRVGRWSSMAVGQMSSRRRALIGQGGASRWGAQRRGE
jgi:hypothetical protein